MFAFNRMIPAFSISQPGHPLDATEFNTFAPNTSGAMINRANIAVLKDVDTPSRQLRELVTDPNPAASRKMPAVERAQDANPFEQPAGAHELLESMMQQKEGNQLILIERCTSREWEITMGENREWEITMGENKRQPALDSEKLAIKEKSDVPDQAHASELPRTLQFFALFDFEMCFAPQGRALFFNISTSKSGPNIRCFVQFDLEMCFAPQRCALGISASKSANMRVFCTF